jgi:hypothetical protein
MKNLIIGGLIALLGCVGADRAAAFTYVNSYSYLNNCDVRSVVDTTTQTASIKVINWGNPNDQWAGGTGWDNGGIVMLGSAVTAAGLSACVDGTVIGLEQNGADGTFATDAYIGIKFTVTSGPLVGNHEYKIGSGSFPVTDTTPPTLSITMADTALKAGETSDVTFTFSEAVTGFTPADISVANGSISVVSSTDGGITWSALFTPTADVTDTTNVITVAMSGVADTVGNAGSGTATGPNYTIDTKRPTATVTSWVWDPANSRYTATMTLSEPITGLPDAKDVTNISGMSISRNTTTEIALSLTPLDISQGGSVTLIAGSLQDLAGNTSEVNLVTSFTNKASQSITFPNPDAQNYGTAPTLSATADSNLVVSFSSSTAGVCSITSGGVLAFLSAGTCIIDATQVGDSTYLAAATVSRSFAVNATVPAAPTDAVATAGDTQVSVAFTAPTNAGGTAITSYTVTSSPGGFTGSGAGSPLTVTGLSNGTAYTFSVRATNSAGTGTASAISNSVTPKATQTITFGNPGTQNSATTPTLTASASSMLAVSFSSSTTSVCSITSGGALGFLGAGTCTVVADQAGSSDYEAAAPVSQSFTVVDTTPPTIAITGLSGPTSGSYSAKITLSEPSATFELADLTLTNASATLSGSGTSYTAILTPTGQGEVKLSVAAGTFTDTAGNDNTASNEVSATFDTLAPTIAITGLSGPTSGSYSATITLSEPSATFELADLALTNASATLSGSGTSYTAILTPTGQGEVKLSVAAGTFTDAAGNGNTASNEVSATFDTLAPTIAITGLSGPISGSYSATITLSEPSATFELADLALTNASATLSGAGTSYTAILTPTGQGEVKLSVAAGTFTDAAGNDNTASNEVSATFDDNGPSVTITAPATTTAQESFSITVLFSEDVTGFTASDINALNATVTGVSGSGTSYVAVLQASGSGDVNLSVPENAAIDAAGNGNLASVTVSIVSQTVEQTQEVIASFVQTRASQLIGNQPSLGGLLTKTSRKSYFLQATGGQGSFDFATGTDTPIWASASGTWTHDGASKSRYAFGAIGASHSINENFLTGAMLQFDLLSEDTGTASISGKGWMIGPYFAAKNAKQPLFIEGRLLYGGSSNKISPFATYEDRFNSTRVLAQFKVSGEFETGGTKLSPFVDASYTTDDQHAYVDGLGNTIPTQAIALGQLELGVDFSRIFDLGTGSLEVFGGVSGIWANTGGSGYVSTVTPNYEGGRGRVEFGLNRVMSQYQWLKATTFYDGLGADGYESYGFAVSSETRF